MIITLCFLPIAIIFIITKISLLLSSSASEIHHVREESTKPHKYLESAYEDVDKAKEAARDRWGHFRLVSGEWHSRARLENPKRS